jgi:hypothetical protein
LKSINRYFTAGVGALRLGTGFSMEEENLMVVPFINMVCTNLCGHHAFRVRVGVTGSPGSGNASKRKKGPPKEVYLFPLPLLLSTAHLKMMIRVAITFF